MIIGLDIGYGFTKAVAGGREIIFPSVVGPAVEIRYHNDLMSTGDGYTYHLDSSDWFIGEFAKLQSPWTTSPRARERTGTEAINVLLCAALHQLGLSSDTRLITGLPVEWYDDRGKMEMQLRGEHAFSVDGQPCHVNVAAVAIVPQPFGSFFSAILDGKGRLVNEKLARGRVAILDIGMHTTDFALADGLRYIEKGSGSIPVAMAKAYELIARELQNRHRLTMDVHDVDAALRDGAMVSVYDQQYSISELARPALKAVAEEILATAMTLWGDARDIQRILVTGGGAYALGDLIKARYPHAIVTQQPALCNARGFWLYGLREWGKDY